MQIIRLVLSQTALEKQEYLKIGSFTVLLSPYNKFFNSGKRQL